MDFKDIKGLEYVKRGMEVAASGGHNILMIGPNGSGKNMLAKRFPKILPDKKSKIQKPHYTISYTEMENKINRGVLFMDKLPKFRLDVLELIRQKLEASNLILIAAMNQCECGNFGDIKKQCKCSPMQMQKYLSRISGNLLDAIDIHIEVPQLDYENISEKRSGEYSFEIKERVVKAREIQLNRSLTLNAYMDLRDIETLCGLSKNANELLKTAILELGISARSYNKILKISRTIADMDNSKVIRTHHISEAVGYRCLDMSIWS